MQQEEDEKAYNRRKHLSQNNPWKLNLCFNKLEDNDLALTHFLSLTLQKEYSNHLDRGGGGGGRVGWYDLKSGYTLIIRL